MGGVDLRHPQHGGPAGETPATRRQQVRLPHRAQIAHQVERRLISDLEPVHIRDRQGEPGPLQKAAKVSHLPHRRDAGGNAALHLGLRLGEGGAKFVQRAAAEQRGDHQAVRLQRQPHLGQKADRVVHTVKRHAADDQIIGITGQRQRLLRAAQRLRLWRPRRRQRSEGRRGVGLNQRPLPRPPAQRLCEQAAARADDGGARKVALHVIQTIRYALRRPRNQEIGVCKEFLNAWRPHLTGVMVKDMHESAYNAPRRALKAPPWARVAAKAALAFVYPPLCPLCRTETAETGGVCASCWREVTFIGGATCRTCGAPVEAGAAGDDNLTCDGCAHAPPAWSRGAAAVVYDGAGRRMILSLKHGDRLDIALLAARWMLKAGRALTEAADVIAPAPLHWRRLAARRFNQAGELARELALAARKEDALALDLMTRTRATPSMDGRGRLDRFANVAGAFELNDPGAVTGRNILLVDDVMTTGATLSACAEICRDAGAKDVNALVFARVARADWPA